MFQYNFWSKVETGQVNNPQGNVDGLVLKRSSYSKLSLKNVILLDSQSTVSVFCNKDFVVYIKKSKSPLILQSNGGSLRLHKTAVFAELGWEVWYSS